nr:hypothetical protein Iba_scaffold60145CG0010 [Ipomoea batatas]
MPSVSHFHLSTTRDRRPWCCYGEFLVPVASGSGGVSLLSSTAAGVQRSSSAVIDEQSSGYDLRILTICQLGGEKLGDSSNLLLDSAATSD